MPGQQIQALEERDPDTTNSLHGDGRGFIKPKSINVTLETKPSLYENVLGIRRMSDLK